MEEEFYHRRAAEEAEKAQLAMATPMDGVDEYLPTRTMTAEELARHRVPKRKSPPKNMAPVAVPVQETDTSRVVPVLYSDNHKISFPDVEADDSELRIEQEDNVLMEGRLDVWHMDKEM